MKRSIKVAALVLQSDQKHHCKEEAGIGGEESRRANADRWDGAPRRVVITPDGGTAEHNPIGIGT